MTKPELPDNCTSNCCINDKVPCIYYQPELEYRFWDRTYQIGQDHICHILRYDCIIIIIEGSVEIAVNNQKYNLKKGSMLTLPLFSVINTRILSTVRIIVLTLEPNNYHLCISQFIEQDESYNDNTRTSLTLLQCNSDIETFLKLLTVYLRQVPFCRQIHTDKANEFGKLLCLSYDKEELREFFRPLVRTEYSFTNQLNRNLEHFTSVTVMAERLNMSVSVFNRTFRKAFCESPYKWLQKHKSKIILQHLTTHKCSIADTIETFGFTSPSHFHRFCTTQYKCTPAELFKKIR